MTTPKKSAPKGTSTGAKKKAPAKAKTADPGSQDTTKVEEKDSTTKVEEKDNKVGESGGKKLPGYVTKRDLGNKDRQDLIKDFNVAFNCDFSKHLKEPKVLKTMQNRLKTQWYEKKDPE